MTTDSSSPTVQTAYAAYLGQKQRFEQIIREPPSDPSDADRIQQLKTEAAQLDEAVQRLQAKMKLDGVSAKRIKDDPASQTALQRAGAALAAMRSEYTALREIHAGQVGEYKERPQRVPFLQVFGFWLVTLVLVGVLVQFVVLPGIEFVQRALRYQEAKDALEARDWDAAIDGFTFTYETGPYSGSEERLIQSYEGAINAAFADADWEQARSYANDLLDVGVANSQATAWLRDSYVREARAALDREAYPETRAALMPIEPLVVSEELLYKRSLFNEAGDLAEAPQPDWDAIEILLQDLVDRPDFGTPNETEIEDSARELLSRSYTERAAALIDAGEYAAAREMLQPAREFPLLEVNNHAVAERLFRESYYQEGLALISEGEYETARARFEIIQALPGAEYRDTETQFRRTYYLPGQAALREGEYETARELFSTLIDLDAPEAPYLDSQTRLYDTFYLPARELMAGEEVTTADYAAARGLLEALFAAPEALGFEAQLNDETQPVNYRDGDVRELYYDTYYRPAVALIDQETPDYEAARGLLEAMFTAPEALGFEAQLNDETQPVNYRNGATLELYYDTYYRPAVALIDQETPDYGAARDLLDALLAAPNRVGFDSLLAVPPIAYADVRVRYYDTYYRPAVALMEQQTPDYAAARDLLEEMLVFDVASVAYEDMPARYYDTYYRPAVALIDQETPDYGAARGLLDALLAAPNRLDFDALLTAPPIDYADVRVRYYDTYYLPALGLMEQETPDYATARGLLDAMLAFDTASVTYEDMPAFYYDTYYFPALERLEADDYAATRELLEVLFAVAGDVELPRGLSSHADGDLLRTYYDTFYRQAQELLDAEDYTAARRLLEALFDAPDAQGLTEIPLEPAAHRGTATLAAYYDTYYLPAQDLLAADEFNAARQLLEALFDAPDAQGLTEIPLEPAAHRAGEALAAYYNTYYLPGLDAYLATDYAAARENFVTILRDPRDGRDHRATELWYLNTFLLTGEALVNVENYPHAQQELGAIRDYRAKLAAQGIPWTYGFTVEEPYALTYLAPAVNAFQEGRYEAARSAFDELLHRLERGEISQVDAEASRQLYQVSFILQAKSLLNAADFEAARDVLLALGEFEGVTPEFERQALDGITRSYTIPAQAAIDAEQYEDAEVLLRELYTDYNDQQTPLVQQQVVDLLLDTYEQLIERNIAEENFDAASTFIARALEIDPNFDTANASILYNFLYELGNSLLEAGNVPEARQQFIELNRLNDAYRDAPTLLLETYYEPAFESYTTGVATQNPALCRVARDELQAMVDEQDGAEDYRDTLNLINQTYICEVDIAFAAGDMETAREVIANFTESSTFYADYTVYERQFIETFYQPALDAFNAGNYAEARLILGSLVDEITQQDTFFYNNAFNLLRESYYIPATQALEAENWVIAQREFDQLFAIDPNYRDVEAQRRQAYLRPANVALEAGDWETARAGYALLRREVNANDAEAAENLRESYFRPAEQAFNLNNWERVQAEIGDLWRIDAGYKAENTIGWLLDSYYTPAIEAFMNGEWEVARQQFNALHTALVNVNGIAEDDDDFGSVLNTLDVVLEGETRYRDSRDRFHDTYLRPGLEALAERDWSSARREFESLIRIAPEYVNPDLDYGNRAVRELLIDAYLTPAENALEAGDWRLVRETLLGLDRTLRGLPPFRLIQRPFEAVQPVGTAVSCSPIRLVLTTTETTVLPEAAHEVLLAGYQIPAVQAIENADWTTARGHWNALLDDYGDALSDEERCQTIANIRTTYTAPVENALASGAYAAARNALETFNTLYRTNVDTAFYRTRLIASYRQPFDQAVALGDWFSAAEHYIELRRLEHITDPAYEAQLDSFLLSTPALRVALADRYQPYWLDGGAINDVRVAAVPGVQVLDATFDATGSRFATVTLDAQVQVWSMTFDGEINPSYTIITTEDWLTEVAWDQVNSAWLATAGSDNRVNIWNAENGQRLAELPTHDALITSLHTAANWLAAGDDGGEVRLWQASDWAAAPQVLTFEQPVSSVKISPDGALLAVALADGQVQLQEIASREEVIQVDTGEAYVDNIVFTPDLTGFVTLAHDGTAQLWALDGTRQFAREAGTGWSLNWTFLANGEVFAALDTAGNVAFWELADWRAAEGRRSQGLPAVTDGRALYFSPDSRRLLIVGLNDDIRLITADVNTYLSRGGTQ